MADKKISTKIVENGNSSTPKHPLSSTTEGVVSGASVAARVAGLTNPVGAAIGAATGISSIVKLGSAVVEHSKDMSAHKEAMNKLDREKRSKLYQRTSYLD